VTAEESREATHERISQPPKVCSIPHFFGEDVSGINTSTDMEDIQSFILYPFINRVFAELHVSDLFRSHDMRPLDASCVIVVEGRRVQVIRDIKPTGSNALSQVAHAND
jgi:hypothetical protein